MRQIKKAIIVTVGNELLDGRRVNTNLVWLSAKLNKLGIIVRKSISIRDDLDEISHELSNISKIEADYVFVTGGLGGTIDDITVASVAKFLKVSTYFDQKYYLKLKKKSIKKGLNESQTLKVQSIALGNVKYMNNKVGTARPFTFKYKNSCYYFFPGVPKELKLIFKKEVAPNLSSKNKVFSCSINLFGITESCVSDKINDLIKKNSNIKFSFLPSLKKISLVLTSLEKQKMEKVKKDISKLLNPYIYSYDDQTLAQAVGEILIENNLTISTCESCTGGKLSDIITKTPGSSTYYKGSIVAYSNEVKNKLLKISDKKIKDKGVVSKDVAVEMANKTSDIMMTDVCISITGYSGPESDKKKQMLGVVYISVKVFDDILTRKYTLPYRREEHKKLSCQIALNNLRLILLKKWNDNIYKLK